MRKKKAAELLGLRIRSLRKSKGLTQEELGASCGINYKYLGAIERGDENPSVSILVKIAEGLGVEVIELFRFHHEESDPSKLKKMITDLVKYEKVERLQVILKKRVWFRNGLTFRNIFATDLAFSSSSYFYSGRVGSGIPTHILDRFASTTLIGDKRRTKQ